MPKQQSAGVREVPGKAQTQPKAKTGPIKVKAIQLGYYDHVRRYPESSGRAADVFVVDEQDFSPRWMERVPDDTPDQVTTAQQALSAIHRETAELRTPPLTGTDRDVL